MNRDRHFPTHYPRRGFGKQGIWSCHFGFVLPNYPRQDQCRNRISIVSWGSTFDFRMVQIDKPPSQRGTAAKECIFLSTHEPCCMCISSIVWTGFQRVYYLFPYELTSQQGIPHDINIIHELWGVATYRKQNKFCTTSCLMELVDELSEEEPKKKELQATIQRLMVSYDDLSKQYHTEKANNEENSLAFG